MDDFRTMPNPALQKPAAKKSSANAAHPPQIRRAQPRPSRRVNAVNAVQPPRSRSQMPRPQPQQRPRQQSSGGLLNWWWLIPAGLGVLLMMGIAFSVLALNVVYSSRILPQVYVGEVRVGGLSQADAASRLQREWQSLTLRDGERTWQITPQAFGLTLDAERTARNAFAQGHGEGGLQAFVQPVSVAPVLGVDAVTFRAELEANATQFNIAAVNAGVTVENGELRATPPQMGRRVLVDETVNRVRAAPQDALAGGELTLVMQDVQPAVTDATPIVERARSVLNNPLDIRIYDPVTGDAIYWSVQPTEWGNWLTVSADPASSIGLSLDADAAQLRAYLQGQAATLDASRTIDIGAAIEEVRATIAAGQTNSATLTVKHQPRTYTVQAGDTITSIGWEFGVPYLYIQQANGGIGSVSVGQQITIPAADTFLKYEVVPDKRIVVDISEQRTRVYENGALKWDWLSSTGISDSPTWTGIYQVISQEKNAYAGNWNLYMPNFIGVYQPVPNADFTNGFHGFPTRGGGRLLWTNDLGRRVTYGCILLSDTNAQLLYDWVETGVVVEIRA